MEATLAGAQAAALQAREEAMQKARRLAQRQAQMSISKVSAAAASRDRRPAAKVPTMAESAMVAAPRTAQSPTPEEHAALTALLDEALDMGLTSQPQRWAQEARNESIPAAAWGPTWLTSRS